jgi:hypothetical protein
MKRYLEQLKPQERRWVVGIGFIVFVVLNYWFVWPHFKEWELDNKKMQTSRDTLTKFRAELAHRPEYERKIKDLESQESVMPEDQAIDFDRYYQNRARESKVLIMNNSRLVTTTNDFFLEQQMSLTVQSGEKELVNFLYTLGSSNSLVRVRAMSLRPDGQHQQLNANVTIVASYQKKAATPSSASGKVAAPAAVATPVVGTQKPVVPTSPKPTILHTNKAFELAPRVASATNKPGPLKIK